MCIKFFWIVTIKVEKDGCVSTIEYLKCIKKKGKSNEPAMLKAVEYELMVVLNMKKLKGS